MKLSHRRATQQCMTCPICQSTPHRHRASCLLSTTPCALTGNSSEAGATPDVYLLQQRAPAMLGRQAEFAENLVEWAQSQGFAQLVVLSGLDATLRKDRQLLGEMTRWVERLLGVEKGCN